MLLEGDKLGTDMMQFAYQEKVSTTMCSWGLTATIDYFNRNGSTVYGAAMDMSKAVYMEEWSELSQSLVEKHREPMFLRPLLFIYSNQQFQVK